jgi:hypothetical protein
MTNVTLVHLREVANRAAKEQLAGDKAHGTAAILAVSALIEGIHAGLFVRVINSTKFPFTERHARDVARFSYNRYDELCMTEGTAEHAYYDKKGLIVATAEELGKWRKAITSALFPYVVGKDTIEDPTANKVKLLKPYEGGTTKDARDRHDSIRKQLDDVDYKRQMVSALLPVACLYIARDPDLSYWLASNTDPTVKSKEFGLWVASFDLIPHDCRAMWPENEPLLIKPVRGSQVRLEYGKRNPKDGNIHKTVVVATFANLAKAWRLVEQASSTEWKDRFDKIAAQVTREWDIPANARDSFNRAFTAMLTFKTEVLDAAAARDNKAPQPAPTSNSPEDDAHTIANRATVTLRSGTQG